MGGDERHHIPVRGNVLVYISLGGRREEALCVCSPSGWNYILGASYFISPYGLATVSPQIQRG